MRKSGRGYDAQHVYMGFNTINNASTFFSSIGSSINFGDMKADAEAIIAEVNSHGGVLGHKLVGVYHDEDVSEATSRPVSNAQKTCAALTQDHSIVAAAINDTVGDDNDTFYGCMKKADTPFFTAVDMMYDQTRFNQFPGYLHSTQGPSADSFGPAFLKRLAQQSYFSKWNASLGAPGTAPVKLGLLFPDNALGRRVAALYAKLAASHAESSTSFFYPADTIADASAAMQSAVVKFRSDGITHVIAPDPNVDFFMIAAEQQKYRPRYAVNSLLQLSQIQQIVPAAQFGGAVGVGWQQYQDIGKPPQTQAAQGCLSSLKRAGVDYGGDAAPTSIALYICDEIHLTVAALKAGGGFSTAALAAGLAKAGPTFQSAVSFRSGFGARRYDIVGGVRDIAFDKGCSCFAYTSATVWPV